jgi:hypothetical protein
VPRAKSDSAPRVDPAPPATGDAGRADLVRAIEALVEECRVECLWYLRPDFQPSTDVERDQILDAIQLHSSRDVFRRAGNLKAWLSRLSSAESASS